MSPVTPEIQLLLGCTATRPSAESRGALAAILQGDLDWRRVFDLAAWHRLAGFMATHLGAAELAEQVPAATLDGLRSLAAGNVAKRMRDKWAMKKVLLALGSEEIPIIVLKGAALAETVYTEAALRPMGDVDLLVEEHRLERAVAVFAELGFHPRDDPEAQQRERQRHRHYPPLYSRDGATCFEVHWHIVRAGSVLHFDIGGFWERARAAEIAGGPARILAPEDLLVHLCINYFKDARQRFPSHGALGKLVDVAETLRCYEGDLDWELFAANVAAFRVAGPVVCVMAAVAELLGAAPPPRVSEGLSPPSLTPAALQRFIEHKVLRPPRDPWHFHELVEPPDAVTWPRQAKSALRRLLHGAPDGQEEGSGAVWTLGRLGDIRRELQVDRWMHGLMSDPQPSTGRG